MLIHLASCSAIKAHPGALVFCGECDVHSFTQAQDSRAREEQQRSEATEVGGIANTYGAGSGRGRSHLVNTGREWVVEEKAVGRRNIAAWALWFGRKARYSLC